MPMYEELIAVADKMEEFAISIEINKDPSIIRDLKRERFHILKIADDLKNAQLRSETVRRNAVHLERMLFYELLRQNDELFLDLAKPIIGEEDFAWRAKHHMFTDQEISAAMSEVIKKEVAI